MRCRAQVQLGKANAGSDPTVTKMESRAVIVAGRHGGVG